MLEMRGGYKFAGNSYEIFEKFFGTSNPFTEIIEGRLNCFNIRICKERY
jgi:hypothetical protein